MRQPVRKRALLSVSDKSNLIEFARNLANLDIEIISTGGTAFILQQNHIPVNDVASVTEFPEILNGRVKTLHPKIHGAILSRAEEDAEVLKKHDIIPIHFVIVNLYPFAKVIANRKSTLADAIENIDIGGPTLIRAAAKNYHYVTIITDSNDYTTVLREIGETGNTHLATRFKLAQKAFAHVAEYDAIISNYFNSMTAEGIKINFPYSYTVQWQKKQELRYGENPHQKAAFYIDHDCQEANIGNAKQLQGKELSFNNIVDADAALDAVKIFHEPACVIVKHANPCGVAVAENLLTAYKKAFACDPTSAFGGIIAFNQALDDGLVETTLKNQFLEVIIAPEVTPAGLEIFKQKPQIRVLTIENLKDKTSLTNIWDFKKITGGLLLQDRDLSGLEEQDIKIATQRSPTSAELKDLLFAWRVVKFVKSNAIIFAKDQMTIGIGAGQMSRIDSVTIAIQKAKNANLSMQGCVLASDAFFPFKDGIEQAIVAGATAIIQPGGSIRDEEVITAADNAGIAMVFTGMRHFKH